MKHSCAKCEHAVIATTANSTKHTLRAPPPNAFFSTRAHSNESFSKRKAAPAAKNTRAENKKKRNKNQHASNIRMGLFDFFRKKTSEEIAAEIEHYLYTIISLNSTKPETLPAANALAKRCLSLLNKIFTVDLKTAKQLEQKLKQIEAAIYYSNIATQAAIALKLAEDLRAACKDSLARKEFMENRMKMPRGQRTTYGRMMSNSEYRRLEKTGVLESVVPGQNIPTFLAPSSVRKFFEKIDKTAIRNMNVKFGGTGHVDHVVFFETTVIPESTTMLRKLSIHEAKFLNGTPVRIVYVIHV